MVQLRVSFFMIFLSFFLENNPPKHHNVGPGMPGFLRES